MLFKILKIFCKNKVKIFNVFVFIVPFSALLYLALIRPVFCIGAIVKPN